MTWYNRTVLILLLVLLVAMPFATFLLQLLRFSAVELGHPLSPTWIKLTVGWKEALLALGMLLFTVKWITRRTFPFVLTRLDVYLLTFIGFAVLWGGQLVDRPVIALFGFRYDLSPFMYYFLARSVVVPREQLIKYLRVLLAVSIPVLLFGMAQTLFLPPDLLEKIGYAWGTSVTGNPLPPVHYAGSFIRAMSTFPGPNSLAMYAVLIFFIAAISPALQVRWQKLALATLSLTVLLVTFSRGHLVSFLGALAIGAGYLVVLRFKKKLLITPTRSAHYFTWGLYLALVATLFGILSIGKLETTPGVGTDLLVHNESSGIHRQVRLQAWEAIQANPFGTGLGTSGLATTNTGGTVFNPESWYIQVTQELGWVGLLGALGVLAAVCFQLSVMLHDLPDEEDLRLVQFFVVAFIAIALSANFLPSWFEVASLSWWVLFGWFVSDYLRSLPRSKTLFKLPAKT